jgi:hypothetical protein
LIIGEIKLPTSQSPKVFLSTRLPTSGGKGHFPEGAPCDKAIWKKKEKLENRKRKPRKINGRSREPKVNSSKLPAKFTYKSLVGTLFENRGLRVEMRITFDPTGGEKRSFLPSGARSGSSKPLRGRFLLL